jgi:hypothetical protein
MASVRILFLIPLFLFCGQITAQELIVRGRIFNGNDELMPFVNIYIKGTSLGTISNEQGEFELNLAMAQGDTLVVSHIGYQQQFIALGTIRSGQSIKIVLVEDIFTLKEVTIRSPNLIKNAKEIVTRAVTQIDVSRNKKSYALKGYYRHLNEQDGEYRQLIEAAITILEPASTDQDPKFNVDQIRRSSDLRIDYNTRSSKEKKGTQATSETLKAKDMSRSSLTLSCWYNNNFARRGSQELNQHGINPCGAYEFGVLNKDFLKEHKFKLDTITTFENEYVYIVKILPSSSSKSYYTFPDKLIIPVGKLYIRTDDFAVLKMEYQYILNPRKKGSDDFETSYRVFGSGIVFQTTALYKEYGDHMYLSFLHTKNYYATSVADRKYRSSTAGGVYNLVDRILLINELVTDSGVVETMHTKTWDDQLYPDRYTYDEDFWKTYTTIVETSSEEKMRRDLEKKSSLEDQFKKGN